MYKNQFNTRSAGCILYRVYSFGYRVRYSHDCVSCHIFRTQSVKIDKLVAQGREIMKTATLLKTRLIQTNHHANDQLLWMCVLFSGEDTLNKIDVCYKKVYEKLICLVGSCSNV